MGSGLELGLGLGLGLGAASPASPASNPRGSWGGGEAGQAARGCWGSEADLVAELHVLPYVHRAHGDGYPIGRCVPRSPQQAAVARHASALAATGGAWRGAPWGVGEASARAVRKAAEGGVRRRRRRRRVCAKRGANAPLLDRANARRHRWRLTARRRSSPLPHTWGAHPWSASRG